MNVVDSSGWLEYFADGHNADFFAPAIEDLRQLVVPSICVFEVFKRVLQQRNETVAIQAAALMQQGRVVSLDSPLAMGAAKLSVASDLPLADSIVLATARMHQAVLWTQDSDFEGMEGVKFPRKRK
jgi:predicted nucleic acid-binding protein